MKGRLAKITCCTAVFFLSAVGSAQQATEQFIPIGMSPGVSSIIGTISRVDYDTHRMTISADGSTKTVSMNSATRYYLDKYKVKQSNEPGDLHDCKVGLRVEVKLADDGSAEWVKIEDTD